MAAVWAKGPGALSGAGAPAGGECHKPPEEAAAATGWAAVPTRSVGSEARGDSAHHVAQATKPSDAKLAQAKEYRSTLLPTSHLGRQSGTCRAQVYQFV